MANSQIRFGRKLKIARVSADLRQSDLAELAGIDQTYISLLERGKRENPTLKTIEALAAALGCAVEDLMPDKAAA